jgi:glyoxylase-like metal-dependent hydrolase (beta-lactamase superfamily II)
MLPRLIPIADNIWIYPHDPQVTQPNIGLIQCGEKTVLVDAGNSPRHGRAIAAEMATMGFGRLHSLIYTHHHWDHIFGAMSHTPLHIVAHQTCAEILSQQAKRPWGSADLRQEAENTPHLAERNMRISTAIDNWQDFRIVRPTITFSNEMELYIEDLTLILQHVGGRHAPDSIVVKVPDAGVMFLGDCIYPPVLHERPPEGDDDLNIPMMEALYAEDYAIYIDGHGNPASREQVAALIEAEKSRQGI